MLCFAGIGVGRGVDGSSGRSGIGDEAGDEAREVAAGVIACDCYQIDGKNRQYVLAVYDGHGPVINVGHAVREAA